MQPSLLFTPPSLQQIRMRDTISKSVITSVSVVVGQLALLTFVGIYNKINKKKRALAKLKDAETKWREVYGHGQEQVMNPVAIEMNSVAIDTFFRRENDSIMQTDVETSVNNVNTINTTNTINTASTHHHKPQSRPKVNALERKLKKRLADDSK
jgi:hypothetical protein